MIYDKPAAHFIMVAESRNGIVGMIDIRENNHICLFFIARDFQGRGIGRRLLERVTAECIEYNSLKVDVNSSLFAVQIYKKLGFVQTKPEQLINGIRFVPTRDVKNIGGEDRLTVSQQRPLLSEQAGSDKIFPWRKCHTRMSRVLFLFLAISFFFSIWCECSYGSEPVPAGPEFLIKKYHEIEKELKKGPLAIPFHLESSESQNVSHGDIYGTVDYPFDVIKNELLVATNWCDIVLPHPDIRACTSEKMFDAWLVNIYSVDKFSKPLEDAYQMKFVYHVGEVHPFYFEIALTAREGPYHTQDHQFGFEAIPLRGSTTFIHLRYSYGYSSWGYFLMRIFGGGKVGFSVVGTESDGNPVYVSGPRGSAERNIVRFYLAILSYLDTLKTPAEQRFDKQISQWYDLAAPYKQLLGMEKDEYLLYKRQDLRSQQKLQSDLNR